MGVRFTNGGYSPAFIEYRPVVLYVSGFNVTKCEGEVAALLQSYISARRFFMEDPRSFQRAIHSVIMRRGLYTATAEVTVRTLYVDMAAREVAENLILAVDGERFEGATLRAWLAMIPGPH